jgi:hypothetical protein
VDPAGKPIEGASVIAGVNDRRPALNGFPDFYSESRALWVKSAADGTYSVTAFRASRAGPTTGTVSAGLRVGEAWIRSPLLAVTANAGETVAAPDLVVDVGALLRTLFVVTDAAGAPIAGAIFEASVSSNLRTGQDGRALWARERGPNTAAPVKTESLVVRARGFAAQKVTFTPATGEPVEVKVVLRPDSRVAGRVQRADGTPAARAGLYVLDAARTVEEVLGDGSAPQIVRRSEAMQFAIYATSAAAEDGTFSVTGLPEGPYHVVALVASRAPQGFGRPPRYLRAAQLGVAAGTEDVTLTIPADDAPPTQALDVVVTDAGGAAIPGCTAQAISESLRLWAEPAGAGKVRFPALSAGKWSVQVSAQGWARTTVPDVLIDAAAPPPALTIRLDRGITLRGAVRAESGALPDGVQVWLSPIEQAADGGSIVAADIGKDGAYTLSGLVAGRHRVTVCTAGGFGTPVFVAPGNAVVTLAESAREATADLVVVRGGTVTMSVRDERLPAAPFTGSGGSDADKDRFAAASRIEVLDTSGTLVFAQSPLYVNLAGTAWLAPGDYTVRLRLSGEAPQDQRVTVKAGASVSARFPSN